jgi:hypothetical protein
MLVCSHFSLPPLVAFDHFMSLFLACHDFFFASPVGAILARGQLLVEKGLTSSFRM